MSKTIDERIVSMQFDNKNFESNVQESMTTLEKLKKALNFKGATSGLEAVDQASKKVNFSGMQNAVDEIGVRFSALQVVATTALANITNSVVNAGKQMVSALTVQPLTSGFQEYETQIGSIQTILSNTRWQNTSLEQVNSALDELNTYADKTIYNFTEMTRNIGTFTAAGVGLDQSVSAIKGIANLAAVSGSTSAQASTAMYQLSQALAAGRVSLMDWNSVVNAGMGGKVFQDALKRTAENLGTNVDAMIEKYGSFRESLTKGQWLTTEVLTETLAQISGAYTEADLLAKGYTKEQAAEIVALAKDAEGAATNVRTFTQLIDTTMEALGSGWTNTWELIIGDFNEAQQLWTDISNYLNDVVGQSADARNNLLQGWRDLGGREAMLEGLKNVFDALLSVIEPIKEVFSEIFPPATADDLMNLTNQFKDFTANLKLSDEAAESLKSIFRGIFNIVKMVIDGLGQAVEFFGNFSEHAADGFQAVLDFGAGIGDFFTTVQKGVEDGTAFSKVMETISTALGDAASGVGNFFSSGIGKIGEIFNSITPDQVNTFLNAIATGAFVTAVKGIKDGLADLGGETESFSDTITNVIKNLTGGFSESVTGVLDSVRGALEAWQQNIKSTALLKIAVAVALLANGIAQMAGLNPQALKDALGAITVLFGELILTMTAFERLSAGLSFGMTGSVGLIAMATAINILASALVKVSDLDTDAITRGVEGLAQLAAIMVVSAKVLSMGGGTAMQGSVQLVIMAAALKLLASVVNDLAALNMDKMAQGLEGVGILLGEIAAFDAWVNGGADLMSSAVSMIFIGTAMKILASSVADLGNLDTGKMAQGLIGLGVVFGEIAALSHLVDGKTLLQSFIPLMGIAGVMYTLAHVLTEIGQLNGTQVANSVGALGVVLAEIVAFIAMLPTDNKKLSVIYQGMPLLAASLVILAAAINLIADLNIEQVGTALAGFAGSMVSLFIGIKAVSGNEKSVAILMLAATALVAMAAALKLLSTIGVAGVAISLASLAGTFIILGTATKLLGPLTPQMFKLAAAVAAFGGSLIAIGIGSTAIILGLSVSMTALITTLANLQGTISQLDPGATAIAIGILVAAFVGLGVAAYVLSPFAPVLLQMALAIAAFGVSCAAVAGSIWLIVAALGALGNMSAEGVQAGIDNFTALILGIVDMLPELIVGIMNSFKSLLLGALDVLVEVAPEIADSFLKVLTETLASLNEYGPQIIDFILSFLIQIIDGVAARIPELVGSISNLLNQLFTAIFDAMSGWSDTEGGTDAALGFLAGAVGLVVALNAIKGLIPGAIQGAALMAVFIAEVGAILTAFGAIQQLTGVSDLINSGGDLLQSIGTAIGQFIGGIVGGIAEGATSTLPQVGISLSQFAMNLVPFLTTMKLVDQSVIDSAVNLAGAIAALTGANLLDQLGSFLTGGSDFTDLGAKLIPFGEAMVEFSDTVQGIDVESVNAAANCGEALAALATALPKEGGLAQAIFGEITDMDDFGDQMVSFGKALKEYGETVVGLNVEDITASAQAGQALSDLASSLPKDGGLAAAIFGETTDMDDFGEQMVAFGEALADYADTVAELDTESISNSVTAGQALSDLATALPDSGGLVEWLFGGSDLGTFGTTLTEFGGALKDYSDSIGEVDFELISQSVDNVRSLASVVSNAVNLDTSGIENIKSIGDIGDALYDYWFSISGVDTAALASSTQSLIQLKDLISGLVGFDSSGVSSFTAALTQLGQASLADLTELFDNADLTSQGTNLAQTFVNGFSSGMSGAGSSISTAISNVTSSLTSSESSFEMSGNDHAGKFASGIQNGISTVVTAVGDMVSSAVGALGDKYQDFYNAGSNLAIGFANGISNSAYAARTAASAMANAAKTAAEQTLDEHSPSKVMMRIGEYAGEGFVNGLTAYSDYSYNAGMTLAESVVEGISTLKGVYDSFTDLDAVYAEFTELAEKLVETEEDQQKETEETTEKTSKLSDALNSVMDSLEGVIDRKKDINALTTIIEKAGDRLSEGFIAELLSSEGAYAGALSEMVNLTEEQLGKLSDVFDDIDISEKIENIVDTVSESIKELSDRTANINAINELITKPGLNLSDAFVAEFMNSSGEYADTAAGLIKLNANQINQIAAMYDKNQSLDRMQSAVDALAESMTDITDKKRDFNALNSVLKRTGVTLDKRFTEELMDASGQFADALAGISEMSDEMLQKLNDTFMENELFDQVQEFISILSDNDGLAEAFEKSGISVEEFVENVVEAGDDISDVASQIEDFAETVADGFSKLSINDQTGITEFVDNLRNNMVVAQDWGRNIETVFDKVSGYPSEMVNAFKQAVLEGGIDQYGRIMQEMAGMSSGAIMQIISLWNQAKVVGSEVGTDIAGSMYNTMNDVGENVTKGMTKGIETGDSDVTNAAYSMCQTTVDAIKSYFKVNGDSGLSDVAYSIGKQVIEGLTTGLTQSATGLTEAMKLVDDAVAYLKSLTDQGIDLQVRVTPVLDMTDFNNKLAALKSSAVSQVSSDIMDTVNSISNSMSQNGVKNEASELTDAVKMLTDKVDSINPDNFGVTYQQNNYSPKALSTAAIYRQTKNQISMAISKSYQLYGGLS